MNQFDKILIHPLDIIPVNKGDILHALKKSDAGFVNFGEAYFSVINFRAVKAWKYHEKMTLNLLVPFGLVKFVFFNESKGSFTEIEIGNNNYKRITVPPKVWFGFMGLHKDFSLIMNIADIEHDPNESQNKEIHALSYSW